MTSATPDALRSSPVPLVLAASIHPSVDASFRNAVAGYPSLGSLDLMRTVALTLFTLTTTSMLGASYLVSTAYPAVTPTPNGLGRHVSVVLIT